jgi:hypothetical protein
MNSTPDLDEAYRAVERTYSQGQFVEALVAAETLLKRLPGEQSDDHLPRLQLLIGHIHLYGLNQAEQALPFYRGVAEANQEPTYRELARQGMQLCEQVLMAGSGSTPGAAPAEAEEAPAPVAAPAMPWLQQLKNPEAAVQQSAAPHRHPQELPPAVPASPIASGPGASPWQASPEPVSAPAEPEPEPQPQAESATVQAQPAGQAQPADQAQPAEPAQVSEQPELEPLPTPSSTPAFSPAEEAELAKGLRRVVLR